MDSKVEVEITTFINPHLFWYIIKNDERTKTLHDLDKIFGDISKSTHYKCSTKFPSFELSEIVAVRLKKKVFRAIIEYICHENTNNKNTSYLCWLIDYGTMIQTDEIHKMSPLGRKTPPLAFQACLNNVVYLEQHLGFDNCGQATITNTSVKTPTTKSYHTSKEILSKANSIQFMKENEDDGIVFGDIIFKDKEDNEKSLRSRLIELDVLKIDENIFEDIKESLNDYKDRNILLIAQICSKNEKILDTLLEDASYDPNEVCTKLMLKYCREFDDDKIIMSEDEFSANSNYRGRAHISGTSISESVSPKVLEDSLSNRKQLIQKYLSHGRSLNRSDQESLLSDSLDETKDTELNDSGMINQAKASTPRANTKIKRLLEAIKSEKKQEATEQLECTKPSKRKIVFYPAGAERSFFTNPVKRNKKASRGYSSRSITSDDSSLNTNHHREQTTPQTKVSQPEITSSGSNLPETDNTDDQSEQDLSKEPQNESSDLPTDMDTDGAENVSTASSFGNNQVVSTLKIKPHCNCKQCEHWTKEENVWEDGPCTLKKVSELVPMTQQRLFKDGKGGIGDTSIISLDYDSMTKVEKRAVPKLLVHSISIPTPVRTVSKLPFHHEVHRSLEQLDYKVAKLIQAYAWPALFRNQNLCMIHGSKTGKTLTYLPVMCTFVLEKVDRYEALLKVSGGPIVIILCSDSKKCEDVYDLAKVLTRRNWTKIQLITYPIGHVNSNHVDIVVTTPLILLEMLKAKAINFKRLCHLILEDGDKILDRHHNETQKIFDLAQSMLQNRVFSKSVQLIVCSEHWNKRLANLLKSLEQVPMVCIGNYLEAALYGKMEFSMKFANSACKEGELRALLKDTFRIHKSVIVCNESEIEDVETILRLKGIDSTVVSDSMSLEEVSLREDMWALAKGGSYTVLVCTDFLLNTMLTVTSANVLIHYSLPSSWTKFVQRFRCLLENCKSPLENSEVNILSRNIVLVDESSEAQMHKFFSYIYSTELKHQVPEKLQKYAESLVKEEEEVKHEHAHALCESVKLFGKCRDPQCRTRHTLAESLDVSQNLPKSGTVRFKITFIQDVTLFSIKLLQHIDGDNKVNEFDEMSDASEDLTACLRISKKKLRNPVLGHVYAFYDSDDSGAYRRAELLRVADDSVRIKLIDQGTVVNTVGARLYRLPTEFNEANKPRAVIDGYLANYIPPFQDEYFCARAFHHLENMLEKIDYKNIIFTGEVHLQLGHALWLKNVHQQVSVSDKVIPGFQMSREIARKNLVEYSNDQLYNLYKLCADADIALPSYEKKQSKSVKIKNDKAVWQWAHLDLENVNEVTFSAAVSPDEIYVRLNKFGNLLYALQKQIQQSLKKPNYPKVHSVNVGGVYLAKDPDGLEYCRAYVLKIEDGKALVFYVDFGDEAVVPSDELRHILDEHVTKLPFQSVECRLEGVSPVGAEWDDHVTDALYEYANEPHTDIFRTLYVKVCQKEPAHILGQKKYSVLMKDGFGNRNALINMLLVECGMALQSADDIGDFEIPSVSPQSDESTDEIDEVIDICKKTDELDENFATDTHRYDIGDIEMFLVNEDNPMDFFNQLSKFTKNEPKTIQNRELPPITAAPAVDYCTPEIYWSQTENTIRISIRLTDIEDYKLTLNKGRILNFKTVKEEKTYILKLMFYETVQSMQHTSPGPDLRVTLIKTKPIDWPRLVLSKQRARNIHYDLSKVVVEEGEKRILTLPKVMDDADSDADDEVDVMYTVTSDLDSDFDLDLQHDSD